MGIVTEKRCTSCGATKPLTEFHHDKNSKDGHVWCCKACVSERCKQWRSEHIDERTEYEKRRWIRDREKIQARNKRWRTNNADTIRESKRAYSSKNSDRIRERRKSWASENKEYKKERGHAWYLTCADAIRERVRQWAKDHPDERRAQHSRRRAAQRGNGGMVLPEEWKALKERYGNACLRCGRKEPDIKLTMDHVIPLKLGGTHTIDNIQPLCMSCNCSKRANHVDYR